MKNNIFKALFAAWSILLIVPNIGFAQAKKASPAPKKTTESAAPLLTAQDSVFMFVHENGQKVLMHPVKKGQTLYSISKFYGISVEELMVYNPWFKDGTAIEVKDKVLVPVPNKAINRYVDKKQLAKYASLYYVVQKGDNLYGISQRYFEMPVSEIKKRNKLTTETVELGQLIHVGWVPVSGVPAEWRAAKPTSSSTTAKGLPKSAEPTAPKQYKAIWAKDKDAVTGNYCLTNLAPKQGVVIVTNPANKKSVEATVVGKLDFAKDPQVKIMLSEKAAEAIGLTEKQNLVTIEVKQ